MHASSTALPNAWRHWVAAPLFVFVAACGGTEPAPRAGTGSTGGPASAAPTAPPPATSMDMGALAPPPAGTTTATSAPTASAEPAAAVEPPVELLAFEHSLPNPASSLALGKRRVAVLTTAGQPWLREGNKWREIPLPQGYLPADSHRDEVRIFFGRDDRPRLMGARLDAAGDATAIYLRWRHGVWKRNKGEIGRLSGRPAEGLFGVLGHADPEVVCKVGDICIIKRLTGWTTVPAGPGRPRVELAGGWAWSLHPRGISRMQQTGWEPVGAPVPWRDPTGVWAGEDDTVWVSAAHEHALYHFDGASWTRLQSPVQGPQGLWGSGRADVWLAADGGAAHYDGTRWRQVAGVEGPVAEVMAREDATDLWLAGASGVWHGTARR